MNGNLNHIKNASEVQAIHQLCPYDHVCHKSVVSMAVNIHLRPRRIAYSRRVERGNYVPDKFLILVVARYLVDLWAL